MDNNESALTVLTTLYPDDTVLDIPHKTPQNIVQTNSLINATYSMSVDEMRVVFLAMNKIETPVKFVKGMVPKIKITPLEFIEAWGIKSNSVWERLRSITEGLFDRTIITYTVDENNRSILAKQRWFTYAEFVDDQDSSHISLRFAPELIPYLYDFSDKFTKYNFAELAKLDTPFSMRLYQYLSQFRNLKKYRKETGVIVTPVIGVDELKESFGVTGKYELISTLKRDVIEPAIKKITHFTDLTVTYDTVKQGKKVTGFIFTILEQNTSITFAPVRKRLPSRPNAKAGSNLEFEWWQRCIKILIDFREELKAYDPALELTKTDLVRLKGYYVNSGSSSKANEIQQIIDSLKSGKKSKKQKPDA